MYISEFACGIAATIITEIALLIVCAIYQSRKKKK